MEKPKKLKPSEILMNAIGFDKEDSASNQEGQVSQNQRNLSIRNRNLWLAGVTICCAIVLVGIIGIVNTDFMNFNNNLKAIIFPGLIGLFCSRNAIHLNIEAKDKRVVFAEGRITLDISEVV